MKKLALIALTLLMTAAFATTASAADYKCKGNRVEKSGSTKYNLRTSSSEIRVEKSGSTRGKAVKRSSKWYVEVSGSTKATFDGNKIYKSGSTWASISDAQRVFDCSKEIAATLWVLMKIGKL